MQLKIFFTQGRYIFNTFNANNMIGNVSFLNCALRKKRPYSVILVLIFSAFSNAGKCGKNADPSTFHAVVTLDPLIQAKTKERQYFED